MNNSKGDLVQPALPARAAATNSTDKIPLYRNIVVRNLTATCPDNAGVILGLPESPIENIVFENVRITATKGLTVRDARAIQLKQSTITPRQGPSLITEHAEVKEF